MQSIRRAPDFQTSKIHKVLVVCITPTIAIRELVESEFSAQWKKYGVEAAASAKVLPANIPLSKAGSGLHR